MQEVQNSTKKTPPTKSIILLGDNESGRSTLISRLKGVESLTKGIGLEYHYIDVKDEDRDGKTSIIFFFISTNLLAFLEHEPVDEL